VTRYDGEMSIEANIKFVTDTMTAFMTSGSPEPLLAAITDDAIIKAVIADGTPISGHFQGRLGFLRYLMAHHTVMEVLDVQTTDVTASETSVVMLGTERARIRKTGDLLDCEIATIFTLRDGKIARMVAMADMTPIVDAYREPDAAT
jgi:ketosteroid isomerase-like protein